MRTLACYVMVCVCIVFLQFNLYATNEIICDPVEGAIVNCFGSELIEQEYKTIVALPESYATNSRKKYPVIYVLDAQWDFELIRGIYGKLRYDKDLPEAIIVGITWNGQNLNIDKLRKRDFAPQKDSTKGAGLFLKILETEIIPRVENNYASNHDRTITGTSLGGLFTTYAMLERPKLFDKVVSLAPAYRLLKKKMRKTLLEGFSEQAKNQKLRFYLACGEFDGCTKTSKRLSQDLSALGLSKFKHRLHLIEGIGHAATTPVGNTHGLIMLFD